MWEQWRLHGQLFHLCVLVFTIKNIIHLVYYNNRMDWVNIIAFALLTGREKNVKLKSVRVIQIHASLEQHVE